jgi:hypothetical protein
MNSPLQPRLQTIDELCDRYKSDWRAHRSSTIQAYLEGVEEEPVRRALLYELVLLDQELNRDSGKTPTLQNYQLHDSDQALLLELSTDLVIPSRSSEPETQQVGRVDPAQARNPLQVVVYPPALDLNLLRHVALGSDCREESRTSVNDLPSSAGGDEGREAPSKNETAGEDVPSTV